MIKDITLKGRYRISSTRVFISNRGFVWWKINLKGRTIAVPTYLLHCTACFVKLKLDQTVRETIDTIYCHQNNGDSLCTCVCCVCQQHICGKKIWKVYKCSYYFMSKFTHQQNLMIFDLIITLYCHNLYLLFII